VLAQGVQGFNDLLEQVTELPCAGVGVDRGVFLPERRGGQSNHGRLTAGVLKGLHDGAIGRRGSAVGFVDQDQSGRAFEILDDFGGALNAFFQQVDEAVRSRNQHGWAEAHVNERFAMLDKILGVVTPESK